MAEQARVAIAEELRRTQRKCFQLREEVRLLHAAFDESETAALRAANAAYRKALTNIAYRLEADGEIEIQTLRNIVYGAVELRSLKPRLRRLLKRSGAR